MQTTEYLYGKQPSELPSMDEALTARISAATELLTTLQEVPLTYRDFHRVNKVRESIEFNTKLLEGSI